MSNVIELPTKDSNLRKILEKLVEANEKLGFLDNKMEQVLLLGVPKNPEYSYIVQQIAGTDNIDPLQTIGLLEYAKHLYNYILTNDPRSQE